MTEHIVATFETEAAADAAVRDLTSAGISSSAIRRYRPTSLADTSHQSAGAASSGGFWAWLLGEEPAGETTRSLYRDEEFYQRGAHAGHSVVSVELGDELQVSRAVTILEAHRPLEMEEDQESSGVDLSASELLSQMPPSHGSADLSGRPVGSVVSPALPPDHVPSGSASGRMDQVIPLAEEQMEIGKRTIDRGTTRIRRYVVERPVAEQVTLRGERVTIERRRPIENTSAPAGAFEERVVEVRETEEVPVVAKTARVVEEVTIRKEETERTETVRDTLRREEVEVTGNRGTEASKL